MFQIFDVLSLEYLRLIMKQSSPLLSVVAPMYNEESVIGHYIEAVTAVLSENFSQY